MGRKGVSKRKAHQTKSQPLAGAKSIDNGSVAALVKATESQPAKSIDTGKAVSRKKKNT